MATPEPEVPLIFDCAGAQLLGILHLGAPDARRAVIIVVGGPQYRVGSHRQFVLLARHLAAAGIPTLRFDYRGMGDSEGDPRSFETIRDDIAAAIDCLFHQLPALRQVVLWGLCDAASASALYAAGDHRVAGLVLLNPWVRTPTGEARAYLWHYYTQRLLSAPFWLKFLRGSVDLRQSLSALRGFIRSAKNAPATDEHPEPNADRVGATDLAPRPDSTSPQRILQSLRDFPGQVLLILSGNDLTAREFDDRLRTAPAWSLWAQREQVERRYLLEADHTFSNETWRAQVQDCTLTWLRST